jgi:hypothetical protein
VGSRRIIVETAPQAANLAGRDDEKRAAYELIMAIHERRDVEDVVSLNRDLSDIEDPERVDLLTGALRIAIDYAHGGNNIPFEKDWFVKLDQRVVRKNEMYECSWVYVAACILAVVADPEIAQTVPRNIGSYHEAMIIEDLVDESRADGQPFDEHLVQMLEWAEQYLDS